MSSWLSPQCAIGAIRIDSVENASCVNLGNNYPSGFASYNKLIQGFGSISGDRNLVSDIRSVLKDSSFLDMLKICDSKTPEWLQTLDSTNEIPIKHVDPDIDQRPNI